jgi:hypothetical protein
MTTEENIEVRCFLGTHAVKMYNLSETQNLLDL